ncbi:prepilin-type N-terminal cleavage/methylation domain-containing protein [Candidatus Desantisbacteria bacterium]|nr:prepilin-type N-terminal cleavage/methylation domain-containing protein [Candidatus Desantisbacteria bacterium]
MNLQHHQKGFTLLEILIAMGITGIIIMLMSSIYINAIRLWLSTDVQMKAQQQARELLSGDPRLKVMKRGTKLADMSRPMNVSWQGILNEFQDMCILLPSYPGGTLTLAPNKARFATEAYIQNGNDTICSSMPAAIQYGTQSISDIQIGTSGANTIFIIHGIDGKFRSTPGDTDGTRTGDIDNLVEIAGTDELLYGRIIRGPDGTISTMKRAGSDDVLTGNTAIGAILINPGTDNRLQSILGDNNGDGDILDGSDQRNPDEYIVGDVISYEFNASNKTVTRVINDNTATNKIIGTDIADFSLAYSDANNLPTTTTGAVKQIFGTVTVAIPKKYGAKYATYTVTFRAHPRKLNSAFGGM